MGGLLLVESRTEALPVVCQVRVYLFCALEWDRLLVRNIYAKNAKSQFN